MKICLYLFLFVTLSACKKPDTTIPLVDDQKKPWGILDFRVKDVQEDHIRFVGLDDVNPNRIIVDLPENYKHQDVVYLTLTLPNGYVLRNFSKEELPTSELPVKFDGQYLWLFLEDTLTHTNGDFYLYINPSTPIKYRSEGKEFNFEINGEYQYAFLSISNWGTDQTISKQDSLWDSGVALLRNVRTGRISKEDCGFYYPNDENKLFVELPPTLEAGEYEVTLQRDDRSVTISDHIKIKYGKPLVRGEDFVLTSAFSDSGNVVDFKGFNLMAGHSYKLKLDNDFIETMTFDLNVKDHHTLQAQLPIGLQMGTYEAVLIIDGVSVKYTNYLTDKNFVFFRKNPYQPALGLLSQKSKKFDTSVGLAFFKPVIDFDRNEEILAYPTSERPFPNAEVKESKLILENTITEKVYELKQTDLINTVGILAYPLYKITDEVPKGSYKVKFSLLFETETEPHVSGLYHKIININ